MTVQRIATIILASCLASPLVNCRHFSQAGQNQIKNLTDDDIALWMAARVGSKICIRARITGTYRFLSFDMDKIKGDVIAPYSGKVYTTITQRYAIENGIELGETIAVCGRLKFDVLHNPNWPPEFHSYVLEHSALIR